MFKNKKYLSMLVILTGLAFQSAAYAQDSDSLAESDIPLYSGGIGDDEMNYIKSVQHQYDVKLLFTEANGVFLSDLQVKVKNKKGETIVSTVTKGPVLLLNLPSGAYKIIATQGDVTREQNLSVSGHSLHSVQFRFPASDAREDDVGQGSGN